MSGNPRKAFLVSAVLVAGTMLMTACQGSDSDDAKGSSPAPQAASQSAANPPGAAAQGGNTGGGAEASGKTSGGQGTSAGTGSGGGNSTGNGSTGNGSSGSGSGSSGSGDGSKVDTCRSDYLDVTALDSTNTGDAEGFVAVTFKNEGKDCSMSGYAGVDLKTNSGSVSAKRTGQEPVSIILKSGESVSFGISYPINDTGGSGVRITDLLVTPPNETKTVTLKWPGGASLPVTDGSGTPVTVGPIGSAGQGG